MNYPLNSVATMLLEFTRPLQCARQISNKKSDKSERDKCPHHRRATNFMTVVSPTSLVYTMLYSMKLIRAHEVQYLF